MRGPGSPFKSKEFLRVSLDFEVAADRQLGGLHVVHRNSSFDGSRGRVRGSSKMHVIIGYSYKLTERKTESPIVRFQLTKFVTVILKRVKMKHQSILRQNDTNHLTLVSQNSYQPIHNAVKKNAFLLLETSLPVLDS